MESDVKIGLFFAAAIAVACGSTRISFTGGEGSATEKAPAIAQVKQADPVVSIPSPSVVGPVEKLAKSDVPADKKKEAEDALAKLFPKDLRKKADETAQKADAIKDDLLVEFDDPLSNAEEPKKAPPQSERSKPAEKEKTSKPTSKANSPEKLDMPKFEDDLLADISGVQNSDEGGKSGDSSPTPTSGSNSPKRLPEPDPDRNLPTKSGKGPVHPYFERFLESGNYFVREGDSLKDIAYNLYQDESRADEILKLNNSVLKKASDLRPGMRLKLPR